MTMIQFTNILGIQVLSEVSSFQSFLVPQPHSSDHVDAIPGYLEWKVSIGQQEQSRNQNSAQNSSGANKQEFLVSTV